MAEQEGSTQDEAQGQQLAIRTIYIKDASFEAPNSPAVFMSGNNQQPQIQMNISVNSHSLGEDNYEVVLTTTVEAKFGDKIGFLVELHQAGVFTISGFQPEELGPMLGMYCPNVLFPYAREAVSSLVAKGGFPQLMLSPVKFEALYHQQQEAAQKQPENATH